MWRIVLLIVVALGLAPGMWVRTTVLADDRPALSLAELPLAGTVIGEFRVAGAWELSSANRLFGGYSGLVPQADGTLLAVSDKGRTLRFTPADRPGRVVQFGYLTEPHTGTKASRDTEGITRDPVSGALWVSYEHRNMIERLDAHVRHQRSVRPAAMREWPRNKGPEAIARLADGKFIVLAEGSAAWFGSDYPALLFPSDPVSGALPERFRFEPPDGYRPVDAAQLPDGRVLILLRRLNWGLPPTFAGKLMIADPASIRSGEKWRGKVVADLAPPLPTDNYEGLAIESGMGGTAVWLISDDNDSGFQRTLLLKLLWRPDEKARGPSRAPS